MNAIRYHKGYVETTAATKPSRTGTKISKRKVIAVLEEENGVVGTAAKRLGVTPKRLYELLKHHNIQARHYR